MTTAFVALPDDDELAFLYDHNGAKVRQVLWGDHLTLDAAVSTDAAWTNVVWGSSSGNPTRLRIASRFVTDKRPLEIVFVDVGQGDGCVLITPERDGSERIMVIDAGKSQHMAEFLEERFKVVRNLADLTFHAAIVTHPDEDHYGGFGHIFRNTNAKFRHLYHSGLVERAVPGEFEKLGGKSKRPGDKVSYLRALPTDDAAFRAEFQRPPGGYVYPKMIKAALDRGAVGSFAMVSTEHGDKAAGKTWLPGFGPGANKPYTIEVLGPWVETDADGAPKLRVLGGGYGVTKNGHSIVLRLQFGQFSVVFGGDLNSPAEKFLLTKHTGIAKWPMTIVERDVFVAEARRTFRADVLKVCHHGAADVTDEFLSAVNPAAFVVSSGDQEGHVHPRPDLLGRLGRLGRGTAPVLLLTELQRSTREREDAKLADTLNTLIAEQVAGPALPARADRIRALVSQLARTNVEVDGAIYLKTDGERLITAFRNEVNSEKEKWFYFRYRLANGMLIPVSVGG
jgi:beta-lactamase superfamily II metal-dependent hydrolase